MRRLLASLIALLLALVAGQAAVAQNFPQPNGTRVVDAANIIPDGQEAALNAKLKALEDGTTRQLVVATIPDLQGYPIEDYGYRLGRAWAIGQKDANNGTILIVAPNDRKTRIEVGYGLEPILTDAFSSVVISTQLVPKFKQGDFAGGIDAGVNALITQMSLPMEEAEKRAAAVAQDKSDDGASIITVIFWLFIFFFFILPVIRSLFGGRRRGRRFDNGPVIIWGGGSDWGSGGGSSWSSGDSGFSGGGGDFGGGGASGDW